jgi:imidazolonepropionase-like amidohydrolase
LDPPSAQRLQIVAELHKAGALLLLGTDAPMLCTVPGFSVHQELQNFVDAGLTPFDALKTATLNPAIFWNQLDERGTVSVGKEADLLLLRANPLDDIRATQEIIGVMVNGEWFASPSCIGQ